MPRFRDVFFVREYRLLWSSTVVSELGDQLARVAIVVLVFRQTSSPGLTALSYALTYLPAIIGGPLLAGLADRHPRRDVMIGADLARAALVIVIAFPVVPIAVVFVLLFLVQMLEAPARAARAAVLPEMLTGEQYTVGVSAYHITNQLTYFSGFALGGLVVGLLGPHPVFAVDGATFLVSASLLRLGIERHPAPERPSERHRAAPGQQAATTIIIRNPALRRLAGLALLASFYMAPPALAMPYVRQIGAGEANIGVLMAALPAGYVAGVYAITRWVPADVRPRLLGPLGLLTCLPLLAAGLTPGLISMSALLALVGVLASYQAIANAEFVRLSPPQHRGVLLGIVGAALTGAQGSLMVTAGVFAEYVGAGGAISALGAIGMLAALPLIRTPHRDTTPLLLSPVTRDR